MKIAILGAESTGKSELVKQLEQYFQAQDKTVQHIPEYLRTWCDVNKRTPRKEEQLAIAIEQTRQIDITLDCDFLIADTTALTIAVYSDLLFNDITLHDLALAHQRKFDVTLLMGMDLPWVADGIQRDGSHMREPVDTALRTALAFGGIDFQMVYGTGQARLKNALLCLDLAMTATAEATETGNKHPQRLRKWVCERCSDPECEHRIFRSLLN